AAGAAGGSDTVTRPTPGGGRSSSAGIVATDDGFGGGFDGGFDGFLLRSSRSAGISGTGPVSVATSASSSAGRSAIVGSSLLLRPTGSASVGSSLRLPFCGASNVSEIGALFAVVLEGGLSSSTPSTRLPKCFWILIPTLWRNLVGSTPPTMTKM